MIYFILALTDYRQTVEVKENTSSSAVFLTNIVCLKVWLLLSWKWKEVPSIPLSILQQAAVFCLLPSHPTLLLSCCISIWMSMSLLRSSSLVAWAVSAITSDFSSFLPFLGGWAEGGVVDDIALLRSYKDRHGLQCVVKWGRESVSAPPPNEALHHRVYITASRCWGFL